MRVVNRKLFGIKKTLSQTPNPSMNETTKSPKPDRVAERECAQTMLKVESKKCERARKLHGVCL